MKTSKTLDMHMSWLRRKLAGARPASGSPPEGDPGGVPGGSAGTHASGADQRISTVRGVGFRFETD